MSDESTKHSQSEKEDSTSYMAHASLNLEHEDQKFKDLPATSKEVQKQGHYRLSKVYYDKADLENAEKYFLKALEYAEFPKDSFGLFKTYGFLIRIYSEREDATRAEKYIKASEELLDNLGRVLGSLNSEYFFNMGVVQNYRGHFDQAKESFSLAYRKSKEENDPEVLVKSLHSLANWHYHTKEFSTALNYLEQLEELLKILNKSYISGAMYNLRGQIHSELGDYNKALLFFARANKSLAKKKCWNLYPYVLLGEGVVYKKMGDYKKAILVFELANNITDHQIFRHLSKRLNDEIADVNDSSVDLYLDRANRVVYEKTLGKIDFKHRFVLLEILFLLAQNPGVPFSKDDLAKQIWKDEYNPLIHDKLIYTSVSRLRKLIEPKDDRRKYILRKKDGYTFNVHVKTRFHREHIKMNESSIGNVEISSPV